MTVANNKLMRIAVQDCGRGGGICVYFQNEDNTWQVYLQILCEGLFNCVQSLLEKDEGMV